MIDIDELQHKDELNRSWVKAWKNAVQKRVQKRRFNGQA